MVRDASKKYAFQESKKSMNEYLSWDKNYRRTAESIQDLRNNPSKYQSKQGYYDEDYFMGDSSCSKKVRSFLTSNRSQETDLNMRKVVEAVLRQWGQLE